MYYLMIAVNKNADILQASVISVYVMFLTWTAIISEPAKVGKSGNNEHTHTLMHAYTRHFLSSSQSTKPLTNASC